MNTAELIAELTAQGVSLWSDRDKLKIQAPKGAITPEIQANLAANKQEILTWLQKQPNPTVDTPTGLSLETIGRLLGGFTPRDASLFKPPVIDPLVMAQRIKVTFRPLPPSFSNDTVVQFREELLQELQSYGVQIVAWSQATRDFAAELQLPLIKKTVATRVVKPEIAAVIDVERPLNKFKSLFAEQFYRIYSLVRGKDRPASLAAITKLTSWAEDHAMQRLEDPTSTQVIMLRELDRNFVTAASYQQKIALGINTLVKTFSEIVIGVSERQVSILNMNLADSLFERQHLKAFILKSLIPKIYVPIAPLPLSRFVLDCYEPQTSTYAQQLVQLSQELKTTGLFPSGFKLAQVIRRQSHRDLVDSIVNGRSGVSYGFVAYAEPPQYIGDRQITAEEWSTLGSVTGFSFESVRQNHLGRRYLKTKIKEKYVYLQIPDIWILSSRSGADKTNLDLERDILRLGLTNNLCLQLPQAIDHKKLDLKPSYDTYVMLAIALAAALYAPQLIEQGAPMIHFHGYPSKDWFTAGENWAGVENPSVPCGTYESGVFNFLSIYKLAQETRQLKLACLIEPDHGTNLVAGNLEYLLARLKTGIEHQQIELGGKHFGSLTRSNQNCK
ncbi:MAG: hypothetical protein AAF383_09780 [Cyanobacteria bacterium P01_A01_bin.83]